MTEGAVQNPSMVVVVVVVVVLVVVVVGPHPSLADHVYVGSSLALSASFP